MRDPDDAFRVTERPYKGPPLARAVWIVAQLVDTALAVIVYGIYELYEWLRGPT